MKRLLALAAASVMALTPLAASAQHYRPDHRGSDYRHGDGRWTHPDFRAYERGYYNGYRYYDAPRKHRYYRGAYLPRGGGYVIDYRAYGYAPPPPGYRYYRTNTGEIVLAVIATGLISAIIADALD
jgi:Ni/Co efflux regulator RcnB